MASLVRSRPIEVATAPPRPAPPASAEPAAWSRYFETLYRDADHDTSRVPWAETEPNPGLLAWLSAEAPSLVRPGATVCVAGCGLGDDVRELAGRGYDVVGFDVSRTAIEWARERHPGLEDRFHVADLFDLPSHLARRADLVVEVYTIQSLHPALRAAAARAIASLARQRGTILTVCRGRDESEPLGDEPPFPLTGSELTSLLAAEGFHPIRPLDDYLDDERPPKRRLRGAFRRG
jgi:SAM-dependent methyltransferase